MDVITAGLLLLFIVIMSWLIFGKTRNLPPGPISLPFLGSLPFLRELKRRPIHEVIREAQKQYGDIFSFRFGRQLFVVLNGYDVIKQALVKQADVCSGRANFLKGFQPALQTGKGVVFQDFNDYWRTLRNFTSQVLTGSGVGRTCLEEKIKQEVTAISQVMYEEKGAPIDINFQLRKVTGNIIYSIAFGKRFDFDDPECLRAEQMLSRIFSAGPTVFNPVSLLPAWVLVFMKEARRLNRVFEKSNNEMFEFFHEQMKNHEDTYDETNIRDFIDLYISSSKMDEDAEKRGLTSGNILRVIMDFYVAGAETLSTSLTWVFLLMSEHPEVQTKCQEEIKGMIGDRIVDYKDREKLLYVEATIRETLRYANTASFAVPHCPTEDTVINGYTLPKDTIILPNLATANMDEKYWTNPAQFDPERFLAEDGTLIRNEAFIPFSVGPRSCIAETLTWMVLFLSLTNLLQRFTFHREDDSNPHSMKSISGQATSQPEYFKLRAHPL